MTIFGSVLVESVEHKGVTDEWSLMYHPRQYDGWTYLCFNERPEKMFIPPESAIDSLP